MRRAEAIASSMLGKMRSPLMRISDRLPREIGAWVSASAARRKPSEPTSGQSSSV